MAFSTSPMFDFELTRILGSTPAGGCDIGEFKTAVSKIKTHDAESWFSAWDVEARRAEKVGNEAAAAGFKVLARNAYLRASNYYRAASYMFNNADARVVPYCKKSIAAFKRATKLFDGNVLCVEIPFEEGVMLPGYLFLPPGTDRLTRKTPVVIFANGADAPKEESYFLYGHHGPQLGYAVLLFDGPGQGLLLKERNIPLRADFEVCVQKTLDFLSDLSTRNPELELDMSRIAIAGAVTGGYFALRSAPDPRIQACVAVDPTYSLWDLAMSRAPQSFVNMWENGYVPDALLDTFTTAFTKANFQATWEMGMMKSGMGVSKPTAMLRRFKEFSLEPERCGDALARIKCPVLLTAPGHGQEMYSSAEAGALRIERRWPGVEEGKVEVWVPGEIAEGGLTAKIGAWPRLSQKTFVFLDGCFGIERRRLDVDLGDEGV